MLPRRQRCRSAITPTGNRYPVRTLDYIRGMSRVGHPIPTPALDGRLLGRRRAAGSVRDGLCVNEHAPAASLKRGSKPNRSAAAAAAPRDDAERRAVRSDPSIRRVRRRRLSGAGPDHLRVLRRRILPHPHRTSAYSTRLIPRSNGCPHAARSDRSSPPGQPAATHSRPCFWAGNSLRPSTSASPASPCDIS